VRGAAKKHVCMRACRQAGGRAGVVRADRIRLGPTAARGHGFPCFSLAATFAGGIGNAERVRRAGLVRWRYRFGGTIHCWPEKRGESRPQQSVQNCEKRRSGEVAHGVAAMLGAGGPASDWMLDGGRFSKGRY